MFYLLELEVNVLVIVTVAVRSDRPVTPPVVAPQAESVAWPVDGIIG